MLTHSTNVQKKVAAAREQHAKEWRTAKGWEADAKLYCQNAEHWQKRAEKAEAELAAPREGCGEERVVERGGVVQIWSD